MPTNYKHTGARVQVTAAGTRTSGSIVADKLDNGGASDIVVAGIAQSNAVSADEYYVQIEGVYNLTVPVSTPAGTLLYVPGAPPTAGNALVLTATSGSNTLFCKTLTATDTSLLADCLLLQPRT